MKYIIYLIIIFLLLCLNLGLFYNLPIEGQTPNLLLLFTMFTALERKDFDFFFIGFISGVVLDFYFTGFFGAYTLGFLCVGLGLNLLVDRFLVLELNWKSLSLLLLGSFTLFNLVLFVYGFAAFKLGWFGDYENLNTFLSAFLPALFYNWLLLYPMYLFSTIVKNLTDNLEVRSRGVIR